MGLSASAAGDNCKKLFCETVRSTTTAMLGRTDPPHAAIASAYLLLLISSTLVVDKTTNRMRPWLIDLVRDHTRTSTYAWGTGTLAYLYRCLGDASRKNVKTMGGCTSLLQV